MKHALTLFAGLLLGLVVALTGPASADKPDPGHENGSRECVGRLDTNCVIHLRWGPRAEGPYRVKFINEESKFCVLYRDASPVFQRCEDYWPFRRPVINPDAAPASP